MYSLAHLPTITIKCQSSVTVLRKILKSIGQVFSPDPDSNSALYLVLDPDQSEVLAALNCVEQLGTGINKFSIGSVGRYPVVTGMVLFWCPHFGVP